MSTRLTAAPAAARPMPADQPEFPWASATPPIPTPDPEHTRPPAARAFLLGYVHTLAVLLGGLVTLLVGWGPASAIPWAATHPWPAATTATTTWVFGASVWLHRRGWRGASLHTVTWAAPAALLAPLTWLGWVSPDGLLFWASLSTLLAVALRMAQTPLVPPQPDPTTPRTTLDRATSPLASGRRPSTAARPVAPRRQPSHPRHHRGT